MRPRKKLIGTLLMTATLQTMSTASFAASTPDLHHEIAACAAKESGVLRLSCFDAIAKSLDLDTPAVETTQAAGKWKSRKETSKIDDSVNYTIWIDAEEEIHSKYGRGGRPTLYIRCSENKTNLFINVGEYLGLEETDVLTRFDKEKASSKKWGISTSNKALFAPYREHITLAKKASKHSRMLVQVTPYGSNSQTMEFDLTGLSTALEPVRNACHWH